MLAEVGGRPFVFHLLDQLVRAELQHVVVCSGFGADQLRSSVGKVYRGLDIEYSREAQPLGTGGALRLALPLVRSATALIVNASVFCEVDISTFWRSAVAARAPAAMVIARVAESGANGRVTFDRANRVTKIERTSTSGPAWIDAGRYLMPRTWLRLIPDDRPVSLERTVLPGWVERGLYAYRAPGAYAELTTPEAYAAAKRLFGPQAR
jgi:NDP-sugar pyrophosphorylase family protein